MDVSAQEVRGKFPSIYYSMGIIHGLDGATHTAKGGTSLTLSTDENASGSQTPRSHGASASWASLHSAKLLH